MADTITKISDLINPQVMADMISAKIPKKIQVTPFAKIDNTLQGVPGDTIKSYYVKGGFSHLIHMTAAHLW